MLLDYKLTRLDDTPDGKINWSWSRVGNKPTITKFITWDWDWIRKEAEKLKIGESRIYHEDV